MQIVAPQSTESFSQRRGYVLPLVLLALMLLSLGAWSFSARMLVEYESTDHFKREAKSRHAALSGLSYVTAVLDTTPGATLSDFQHRPDLFQNVPVSPDGSVRFTVINASDPSGILQFGVADESGKLNLELLASLQDQELARSFLMAVPRMTPDLADGMLDWIDSDDEPREFGAERESYPGREAPRIPRNATPPTLAELVGVRGMTPELMFGEDHNRNGLLDPNEDDGLANIPPDNADGRLDRGFSCWITVHSRETRFRSGGVERIDLNSGSLAEQFDRIEPLFGTTMARFVLAYRLYGPFPPDPSARIKPQPPMPELLANPADSQEHDEPPSDEPPEDQPPVSDEEEEPAVLDGVVSRVKPRAERAGLPVDEEPQFRINSVYDLIARSVAYVDESGQLMQNPMLTTPDRLREQLRLLEDSMTVSADGVRAGRLNVRTAPEELLASIPYAGRALVELRQSRDMSDFHIADLYAESHVDLDTLRRLAPLITSRGDVGLVQVMGYVVPRGPVYRIEALLDASDVLQTRTRWVRDLTLSGSSGRLLQRVTN